MILRAAFLGLNLFRGWVMKMKLRKIPDKSAVSVIEPLECRSLMSVSLLPAVNLGNLVGAATEPRRAGHEDLQDFLCSIRNLLHVRRHG